MVFIKILQTFYEVASLQPASFLKRDSNTSAFLWSLRNFKEYLFWGISANGCFWKDSIKKLFLKTLQYSQGKSSQWLVFCEKGVLGGW